MKFNEEVTVVCGPMYSGKSHAIVFHCDKLRWAKIPFKVFKANVDRFKNEVGSRYKDTKEEAIPIDVKNPKEIFNHIDLDKIELPYTVIIDEGQFYSDDIVEVVIKLAKRGINVIISGLDMEENMIPFGPMPKLMAIATKVIKTTSACTYCKNIATKLGCKESKPGVLRVGDEDQFFPLCTQCWHKLYPDKF